MYMSPSAQKTVMYTTSAATAIVTPLKWSKNLGVGVAHAELGSVRKLGQGTDTIQNVHTAG